ncbi:MAG: tyrosine-protein phosphatase [Bacteroidaceae bacterium]|nr:tyrosine-protein phosphatase [Bacteroidaceae bacterium]
MKRDLLYTMAFAAFLRAAPAQAKVRKYNLENPQVKAFCDQVSYPDDDYSYSLVKKYSQSMPYRLDQPWPVVLSWESGQVTDKLQVTVREVRPGQKTVIDKSIDGHTSSFLAWNLTPGRTYTYTVTNGDQTLAKGKFQTTGRRRMIYAPSVHNVRDFGGLVTTDGRTLQYGKIYRGGQLTFKGDKDENRNTVVNQVSEEDIRLMHDDLGIRAEVDFRFDHELGYNDDLDGNDINFSPLGKDVDYYNIQTHHGGDFEKDKLHGKVLKTILQYLRRGDAVYVHCVAGADRTGMMCLLLEGLLGVPESELLKDYELTTFSVYGHRHRDGHDMSHGLPLLKAFPGQTLQEKITNLFLEEGATQQEIDEFRQLML